MAGRFLTADPVSGPPALAMDKPCGQRFILIAARLTRRPLRVALSPNRRKQPEEIAPHSALGLPLVSEAEPRPRIRFGGVPSRWVQNIYIGNQPLLTWSTCRDAMRLGADELFDRKFWLSGPNYRRMLLVSGDSIADLY